MTKREEELYFLVHGLDATTAGKMNAMLEAELARHQYGLQPLSQQAGPSQPDAKAGDADGHERD